MTKRKSINVHMSLEEIEAYNEARGDRSHRTVLLEGVGLKAVDKKVGRPTAEDNLRRANEKWRSQLRDEVRKKLVSANKSFDADVLKSMGVDDYEDFKGNYENRFREKGRLPVRDDLVEEEYQGNAGYITLSKRARLFHSISLVEWNALTETEKLKRIFELPPEKLGYNTRE